MRNKSAQPYPNVTVNFYRANFLGTEFLYPVDWRPQEALGSATIASVPAAAGGVDGTAIAKIEWTADKIPPAAGWHPCLLCEVIPMEVTPSGLHHVFENRKLAQRNISIVNPPPSPIKEEGGPARADRAFLFAVPFRVGHELRAGRRVELRIAAERPLDPVQLFLDPASLVEGIQDDAEGITVPLPNGPAGTPRIEDGVEAIPDLPPAALGQPGSLPGGSLTGVTVFIPAGTEFGLLPDAAADERSMLRLRFRDEARIEVGHRRRGGVMERYALNGLRPVVLNGWPLLHVTNARDARLTLHLVPGQTSTLRLIGIVPADPGRPASAVYHVTEAVGQTVLGGLSVHVNT